MVVATSDAPRTSPTPRTTTMGGEGAGGKARKRVTSGGGAKARPVERWGLRLPTKPAPLPLVEGTQGQGGGRANPSRPTATSSSSRGGSKRRGGPAPAQWSVGRRRPGPAISRWAAPGEEARPQRRCSRGRPPSSPQEAYRRGTRRVRAAGGGEGDGPTLSPEARGAGGRSLGVGRHGAAAHYRPPVGPTSDARDTFVSACVARRPLDRGRQSIRTLRAERPSRGRPTLQKIRARFGFFVFDRPSIFASLVQFYESLTADA